MNGLLHPAGDGVYWVDTLEGNEPGRTSLYLVEHPEGLGVVDPGPSLAHPRLRDAVAALGYSPEAVTFIALTHLHIDHAGGTAEAAERFPRARVIVHPRALSHLVDPTRLARGTRQVWGDATVTRFGPIRPVAPGRLEGIADGQPLSAAGDLVALHAPGHARHHMVLWDPARRLLFAGDAAGVSLPGLREALGGWPAALPSMVPPELDPAAMQASLRRLRALAPRRIFLSHFGPFPGKPEELLDELGELTHAIVARARAISAEVWQPVGHAVEPFPGGSAPEEDPPPWTFVWQPFARACLEAAREVWAGWGVPVEALAPQTLATDLWLNGLGLAAWTWRTFNPRAR